MIVMNEQTVRQRIEAAEPFSALLFDGSIKICITRFEPFVGTAIHHGSRVRPELVDCYALTAAERKFEEDPYTGDFIDALPVTLQVEDSRYEYDLNRTPTACIYDVAWGRRVWRLPPTENQRRVSLEKHALYYRLLESLVSALERRFGFCILYDVHAYNFSRRSDVTPVFNLGTQWIDLTRWGEAVDGFCAALKTVRLPAVPVDVMINAVFSGEGYQARFISKRFPGSLLLPLEIKKVYMSETTFVPIPAVFTALQRQLAGVFNAHADWVRQWIQR
jgi:N-formylglutamate amidohydrolase